MQNPDYYSIDMEKTGIKLKECVTEAGYNVKDIQKYLRLSCPQPVYRWFKGKTLPSINHMYMLCLLLNRHMEDLLVPKDFMLPVIVKERPAYRRMQERMKYYYRRLQEIILYVRSSTMAKTMTLDKNMCRNAQEYTQELAVE